MQHKTTPARAKFFICCVKPIIFSFKFCPFVTEGHIIKFCYMLRLTFNNNGLDTICYRFYIAFQNLVAVFVQSNIETGSSAPHIDLFICLIKCSVRRFNCILLMVPYLEVKKGHFCFMACLVALIRERKAGLFYRRIIFCLPLIFCLPGFAPPIKLFI